MFALSPALQLLFLMFAGWVNRQQLDVIEYLQEENRVLKVRLGDKRIRFIDAERTSSGEKAQGVEPRSSARTQDAGHAGHVDAMVP